MLALNSFLTRDVNMIRVQLIRWRISRIEKELCYSNKLEFWGFYRLLRDKTYCFCIFKAIRKSDFFQIEQFKRRMVYHGSERNIKVND